MHSRLVVLGLFALAACHSGSDSDSDSPLPTQPIVFNLGLAADRVFGNGAQRLVAASEAEAGRDLDGDQDLADSVLQILDLPTGVLSNTGLAFPFDTLLNQPRAGGDVVPPARFAFNEALGVFQVSEAETGTDLDHDGTLAVTNWIFDLHTGRLSQLSFAHTSVELGGDLAALGDGDVLRVFDARDGSLTTRLVAPATVQDTRDDLVAFTLDEVGITDWNADGDRSDHAVMQIYDGKTRRIVNTTLESVSRAHIADGFVGFNASEALNGGLDLNGDGDADDRVFVAVEGATGLTRILPFGGTILDVQGASGPGFLLDVHEAGADANGDGDGFDRLTLFYDPRSQRVLDTGLALPAERTVRGERWLGLSVPEAQQGADLDHDGKLESTVAQVFDTETGRSVNLGFNGFFLAALEHQLLGVRIEIDGDVVLNEELFVWDTRTARLRQTGVEISDVLSSAGDRALLLADERERDLNGDGDQSDFVLGAYDGATGTIQNLGLAIAHFNVRLGPGSQTAVLVSEFAQGRDLNGDGDELDDVLYRIDLAPESQGIVVGE